VLKGIVERFIKFRESYGTSSSNFDQVPIYDNSHFKLARGTDQFFDKPFFDNFLGGLSEEVRNSLTWSKMMQNGAFMDRNQLSMNLGPEINVTVRAYARLSSGFKHAKEKFEKVTTTHQKASLGDFFNKIKKGSALPEQSEETKECMYYAASAHLCVSYRFTGSG
jgi:hypothetical protein